MKWEGQPYIMRKSVFKPSQINNENLQIDNKKILLPPHDTNRNYEKKEKIEEKDLIERDMQKRKNLGKI